MDYSKFEYTLNKHIFGSEKLNLLKKIADKPERYVGLFRPTKPYAKILQNLLQSHEIKFGDAMEDFITLLLEEKGFVVLNKKIENEDGKSLSLDQYFSKEGHYYFMEQKMRDDHDSSKKRGQIANFLEKLDVLYKKHGKDVSAIMYFMDPDLQKNKNFYKEELKEIKQTYEIEVFLYYGDEFFVDFLKDGDMWDKILLWLKKWKNKIPDIPEVNMDSDPSASASEIKELGIRYWRKIIREERLWEEGIISTLFKKGDTLRHIIKEYKKSDLPAYKNIATQLEEKCVKYFDSW